MIKAFIFDLDGTLLDSEILWVDVVGEALKKKGCVMAQSDAMKLVYGMAWSDIYRNVEKMFPGVYPGIEEMQKATEDMYYEIVKTKDIRIVSSINLLEKLSVKYPVAIVSGSTRETIRKAIKFMKIQEHVDYVLGSEDYSPGKPDPVCFLLAAKKMGVSPDECMVFEDSAAGVNGAKAAGMICIALQRAGRPKQNVNQADEILSDLAGFSPEKYGIILDSREK